MSYVLDEALHKLTLSEAFSDTVPSWLKDVLLKGARGYSTGRTPSRYDGYNNLFNLLLRAGYDPSKINIVETTPPDKYNEGPLFNDYTKLPILNVVTKTDNQIFIPGINDDFRYTDDAGNIKSFKYFNNAQYKMYVKDKGHFAYIDLADKNTHIPQLTYDRSKTNKYIYSGNGGVNAIQSEPNLRITQKRLKDLRDRGEQTYQSFEYGPGKTTGNKWWKKADLIDKSGYWRGYPEKLTNWPIGNNMVGDKYLINPRLRKLLKEKQADKAVGMFLALEPQLLKLYDLIRLKQQSNMFSTKDLQTFRRGTLEADKYLIYNFQNLISSFENIQGYIDPNTGQFQEWYKNRVVDDINTLKSNIADFTRKNDLEQFETGSFIW